MPGLNMFKKLDCANALRSVAMAMGGGVRLSAELLDGVTTREQEKLIAAYKAGARDALISTGFAFGLEPVGPSMQVQPGELPAVAGLLWAESPHER